MTGQPDPESAADSSAGMPYLAGLLLAGRRVVAVGGGNVNSRRIPRLLAAGALVSVVSPALTPELKALAAAGRITWVPREFAAGDLDDAWYVLAATDAPAVNAAVVAAAQARHTFCVRADAADLGSAWTPAVGAIPGGSVAVLGHHNPRRSARLRDHIVALLNAGTPEPEPRPAIGEVTLVGGGPGDPGLLTVAGLQALRQADVVLYDHLAPLACLAEARADALLIDVAKVPGGRQVAQSEIEALLVRHASAGARVVRFKGGDPFVFGRGGEEWLACAAAGIPVRVIPGVSAAIAGPALAGIPLTHRGLSQGFTVVSGHLSPGDPASTLNWDALAHTSGTIVILMGVANLEPICRGLIERGLASDLPAAIVASAALPEQQVLRGTVATLPGLAASAGIKAPALTVIGAVARLDLT